uniref:SHSP domain-containing protein n=1 Tax=Steinernema glaseri TaxID=37863 RepID=A0A1I7ZP63_9BILA
MNPEVESSYCLTVPRPKRTRSLSSSCSDWVVPSGDPGTFARMKCTEEGFEARIHLDYFSPRYDPEEIFVDVCGHDLQINARKEHPETPFRALRKFHRQYRIPENVDLSTVKIRRNRTNSIVRIEAKFFPEPQRQEDHLSVETKRRSSKVSSKTFKPILEFICVNLFKLSTYT